MLNSDRGHLLFWVCPNYFVIFDSLTTVSDMTDYANLFRLNPMPIWVYEINTFKILDVNDSAVKFYGYSREEFLKKTIKELRPEKEVPKLVSAHEGILEETGNIYFGVFTHKKKNGVHVQMEINGHKLIFKGKECVLVVCTDVTEKLEKDRVFQEIQSIMNASLDVITAIDEEGKFLRVSKASESLWGYRPDELIGQKYIDLVIEEDKALTNKAAEDIISGMNLTTFENRYRMKNGEIAFNIWSAHWDHEAKVMYAIARNGIEKKQDEQRLKESESRFKSLVQEGLDLIAILDHEGNYKYVSPTSTHVLGFPPETFLGKSPFEFIHPDDAEKTLDSLGRIVTEKRVEVEPFRFKNDKGEWRWIKTILTNLIDHPSIEGIVANSRDITDQIEEQNKLKLFQNVIHNIHDAVVVTEAEPQDEPGPKIVYVNPAFSEMTGYTSGEVIGKSPRFLQGKRLDRDELDRMRRSMRKWEACEVTTRNYKKNGDEFWVNFKISPVADEKGWYTHWIAIEKDVTKSKNDEIQKDLLSRISRDFGNDHDLYHSLNALCKTIVSFDHFSFCEIWLPSPSNEFIRQISKCTGDSSGVRFDELSSCVNNLLIGEGLPGKVWKTAKSEIWENVSKNKQFLRRDAAIEAGINNVFGLPLIHHSQVVGILVIGTVRDKSALINNKGIFDKLKTYIGSEIHRKRMESDLKHLFEAVPILICLTDFLGKFLKINKAGCQKLGYNEEELLGHYFHEFIHPEDKKRSLEQLKKIISGDTVLKFENRFITKAGKVIWLSWVSDANINEGVIYSTARNISNEIQLRNLVKSASELASIGEWEINMVNNTLYWSDVVHEIHETDREHFSPDISNAILFYRTDYREKMEAIFNDCIQHKKDFDIVAPLITQGGKEKWVRAIGKPEFDGEKCIRVYGSFQDITEFKEVQIRLESIIQDLPGVSFQYFIFPEGTDQVMNVSNASTEVWGRSPEECESNLSAIWDDIRRGGQFEYVAASIQDATRNRQQWHARFRVIRETGEIKYHEGFGSPHYLPDGTVLFNSMIFDITEEEEAVILNQKTAKLARIGSWELNLKDNSEQRMYWSPVLREILEVSDDYNPTLTGGFEFYLEKHLQVIKNAVDRLKTDGIPFDEELLIKTAKGKTKWIRCIGDADFVDGDCIRLYGSYQDINERKILDEKVHEILYSITDAFYAIDKNWNFTYFNREAEELLKIKSNDVLGRNIWEVFPAAKGTELDCLYSKVIETGTSQNFEYFYPGDNCWYEINAYPSSGGLASYFRNIDLKKKASEELKNLYEEKNQILESIGDAFFAVDNDWNVTYWNRMAEIVLEKPKEFIVGKNLWEVYHDAIDSRFYVNYHFAKENDEVVTFEEYYPTLKKWFEVTAYPSDSGLSVYFKDITLRKETDLIILQANERFEKVTQATTDAIWDWDIANDIFYRGSGFEELFGYPVKNKMNLTDFWSDKFHPEDIESIQKSLDLALKSPDQEFWQMEYRIAHTNGEIKTVVNKGMIIRDETGNAVRMVGAITDITDRKRYEFELKELNEKLINHAAELEQSNEQLEQFAYIASHDLQEPLRMISSFLNQLQRRYNDQLDEKAQQYIYFATDGAKRMKQIILDLLDYSRAGKLNDDLEHVDLNEVLEEYLVLRKKIIEDKKAKINISPLPVVTCHRAPLIQTIHNIVDNALKYCKPSEKPIVDIHVEEYEGHWEITVSDNGIGIDKQFFDKIFVIFQRLHNRDEFGGTGIGLSIARKNVESWGGKIWLESTLNQGSKFHFTIIKV